MTRVRPRVSQVGCVNKSLRKVKSCEVQPSPLLLLLLICYTDLSVTVRRLSDAAQAGCVTNMHPATDVRRARLTPKYPRIKSNIECNSGMSLAFVVGGEMKIMDRGQVTI